MVETLDKTKIIENWKFISPIERWKIISDFEESADVIVVSLSRKNLQRSKSRFSRKKMIISIETALEFIENREKFVREMNS